MLGGCLHGWDCPAADPRHYVQTSGPNVAEGLPELCFSVLPSTGALICIKRGESGYYPSDWDTGDPAQNRELADYNNQRLGVTAAQRLAMEAWSMHGWDCPAADPKTYEQASGAPAEAQRSGFGGERNSSEMSELRPQDGARDMELGATTMGGLSL